MFILSETSREMLAIFLIAVTGYLIGRVHIKGISLGSSGIFLAGLLFGHFGVSISPSIQTLGLLLFIASVGLSAGPTFFRQLRTNGRAYILLCITVAAVGAVTCGAIILLAHVDTPLAVGMMAGAFRAWRPPGRPSPEKPRRPASPPDTASSIPWEWCARSCSSRSCPGCSTRTWPTSGR